METEKQWLDLGKMEADTVFLPAIQPKVAIHGGIAYIQTHSCVTEAKLAHGAAI
jgi:hypothetical protein